MKTQWPNNWSMQTRRVT